LPNIHLFFAFFPYADCEISEAAQSSASYDTQETIPVVGVTTEKSGKYMQINTICISDIYIFACLYCMSRRSIFFG
jgi:hypothetical protein